MAAIPGSSPAGKAMPILRPAVSTATHLHSGSLGVDKQSASPGAFPASVPVVTEMPLFERQSLNKSGIQNLTVLSQWCPAAVCRLPAVCLRCKKKSALQHGCGRASGSPARLP